MLHLTVASCAALIKTHGWAERDRELHIKIGRSTYSAKTVSVTCMTTLDDPSGTFLSNARVDSNQAEQWLDFVLLAIQAGERPRAVPLFTH